MKSNIDFHHFTTRDGLTTQLVTTIAEILAGGVQDNDQASLAVSGGSTPIQLFKELSSVELAWQDIGISLVDERWVDPTDHDSNEHLVRTHLLQNRAAGARFCGMKNSAGTAQAGEAECTRLLHQGHQPSDVLLLGMGDDGHTASLFPGAEKLAEAVDMNSGKICMGIAPVTAPHARMTRTLPAILAARHIFLHITGQNKKDVLDQACADGPPGEMPIRYILQHLSNQKKPLQVYWAK